MMMMIESKNVGWMMMAANAAAAAVWTGDDDDDDVDDSSSSWCFFLSSHTKQCNKCIPNVLVVVVSRRTPASRVSFLSIHLSRPQLGYQIFNLPCGAHVSKFGAFPGSTLPSM